MPLFDSHAYFGAGGISIGLDSQAAVQSFMERSSVDAVALISSRARHSDFIEGNHQLRQVLSEEMGIFGYVTLNPAYPDESIQEQKVYLARHAFIGAALFPQNGTPVMLADVRELLTAQRRYGKPVLIYVENRDGVRAAREMAAEYEQMKFVLLNMGGHDWRYAVNIARNLANIYLDISGTLDADKIAYASSVMSPRRLLFGSAYPHAEPSLYLGMLNESATVSEVDYRRITHENALNLFQIEAELE